MSLLLLILTGCEPNRRFNPELGQTLPVVLGVSTTSGTELRLTFQTREIGDGQAAPALVATVTSGPDTAVRDLSVYYRALRFPGEERLKREQYRELQAAVDEVLRGVGTGALRDLSVGDPPAQRPEVFAVLNLPETGTVATNALSQYVVAWSAGATVERDGRLHSTIAGTFVFDGERVYDVIVDR